MQPALMRSLILLALLFTGTAHADILFPYGSGGTAPAPPTCPAGAPNINSCTAVASTIASDPDCTVLTPFILEIGNTSGPLYTGTGGTAYSGSTTLASMATPFTWASGSKSLYGAYVAQVAGGPASVPSPQQPFLNFTSGYVNMGTTGTACSGLSLKTIDGCLGSNPAYTTQTASVVGVFDYDSAHFENHAGQYESGINTLLPTAMGNAIFSELGLTHTAFYTNPLLAGALYGPGADYRAFLIAIMNGSLSIGAAMTYNAQCTENGATYSVDASGNSTTPFTCAQGGSCVLANTCSPFSGYLMYYSMGHWIEACTQDAYCDGAFSDAGAYGLYPWIEKNMAYYGILARSDPPAHHGLGQQGIASFKCGRKARKAWDSGTAQ